MADTSGFRTKFGGFNKEDVLAYIDSLQEESATQMEELRQQAEAQREAYDKALNDANAALAEQFHALQEERAEQERLQQLIEEQYQANRVLREQAQTLRDEAQRARAQASDVQEKLSQREQELADLQRSEEEHARTCAQLQTRQQEWSATAAELASMKEQLHRLEGESARWEARSREYRRLTGELGGAAEEIRSMGQRCREDAIAQLQNRLTAVAAAVSELSQALDGTAQELEKVREEMAAQTDGTGQQLDALADKLDRVLEHTADAGSQPPAASHFF